MATASHSECDAAIRFLESVFGGALQRAGFRLWDGALWPDEQPRAVTFVLNEEELAPGSVTVSWAGIRNVWDVVIDRVMSDGDVVELRFDTEQIHVLTPPDDLTGWTPDRSSRRGR